MCFSKLSGNEDISFEKLRLKQQTSKQVYFCTDIILTELSKKYSRFQFGIQQGIKTITTHVTRVSHKKIN